MQVNSFSSQNKKPFLAGKPLVKDEPKVGHNDPTIVVSNDGNSNSSKELNNPSQGLNNKNWSA